MSTLDEYPIRFREVKQGTKPGMCFLVFDGERDGIWKNSYQCEIDEATAVKIQRFCEERVARGLPIWKRDIEEIFVLKFN